MDNSGKIRISDAKDLYSVLPEELRGEFSIGMHEFRDGGSFGGRAENLQGNWSQETVQEVKSSILDEGLKFSKHSYLLSTVMFDESSFKDYLSGVCTQLGGVIIALPKVMRSESGKEIFVGSPNENSKFRKNWARREQATSLSDLMLPSEGVLDSMFVIGTYTKTDKGIEVTLNQNHIAFNKGRVPDDFFEERYAKLTNGELDGLDDAVVEETISQQQNYKSKLNPLFDLKTQETERAQHVIDYMNAHGQEGVITQEEVDMIIAELTHFRAIGLNEMSDTIKKLTEQVKVKDERIERLSMAIAEMREAGLDDERIAHMMGDTRNGVEVSDMEELRIMVRTFKKYGIDDIKNEDYASHDDKQSDEMKAIIERLMQPQEQQPSTEEIIYTQSGIAQEKVDRIRMAIEEMRAAGIDDETIVAKFGINQVMKFQGPEQYKIMQQIFEKYGIDAIKEEDYNAHSFRQSDEIRTLIAELMKKQEQELEGEQETEFPNSSRQEDFTQTGDVLKSKPEEEQQPSYSEIEIPKTEISKDNVERLRMAIQEAKKQGMDEETIKKYIYPFQTVKGWKQEDFNKWAEISAKYGISEIMCKDYMSPDKKYTGFSIEMRDTIDGLTQEEIQEMGNAQFSSTQETESKDIELVEYGKKSYQHFGNRIAKRIRETVRALKSRFFSKDKTEDLTNGR